MRRLLAAIFGLTLGLIGSPALAGWQATEWGMTPDQVLAAMPGTQTQTHGERLDGKIARVRGRYALADLSVPATYFFDDDGLALVRLDIPARQCRNVLQQILDERGAPLRISDQAILRLLIWHDEPTATRVRVLVSSGMCPVHFERLSEYREHDLSEAGSG